MKDYKKDKPKESEFKKFVKKRAPIYLAVAALIVVFVIPELTKKDLQSYFPENLAVQEREALDFLMGYRGPDGGGLSMMEAVSGKIGEEYPGENIYDNKKTSIDVMVSRTDAGSYQVLLDFESYKGKTSYSWDVDVDTGKIKANNPKSKHAVDLVNFYD